MILNLDERIFFPCFNNLEELSHFYEELESGVNVWRLVTTAKAVVTKNPQKQKLLSFTASDFTLYFMT